MADQLIINTQFLNGLNFFILAIPAILGFISQSIRIFINPNDFMKRIDKKKDKFLKRLKTDFSHTIDHALRQLIDEPISSQAISESPDVVYLEESLRCFSVLTSMEITRNRIKSILIQLLFSAIIASIGVIFFQSGNVILMLTSLVAIIIIFVWQITLVIHTFILNDQFEKQESSS
ncbi:MAG: hypothetical protein HQ568_03850 [Calditrichaeota bacterium]|nr:hypothetical protein [Calditrichota bacterium]